MKKHTKVAIIAAVIVAILACLIGWFLNSHAGWIGEQPETSTYIRKTIGLLSDMPHFTGELIFDAIENTITFFVIWFVAQSQITKRVESEHARLDAEHGIQHNEDGSVSHS